MIQFIGKVLDFDIELTMSKIINFFIETTCAKANKKLSYKNLKTTSEFLWHAGKKENHEKI